MVSVQLLKELIGKDVIRTFTCGFLTESETFRDVHGFNFVRYQIM